MIRRSYIIKTEEGQTLRRNRRDLIRTCERYGKEYPDLEHRQGTHNRTVRAGVETTQMMNMQLLVATPKYM